MSPKTRHSLENPITGAEHSISHPPLSLAPRPSSGRRMTAQIGKQSFHRRHKNDGEIGTGQVNLRLGNFIYSGEIQSFI
jgi:hypothetical protein